MGRPSDFTNEIADEICERLSDGESLKSICSADNFPRCSTVFRWIAANETFRDMYARAREAQADVYADEIVHIADTPQVGTKQKLSIHGVETITGDMVEHRRLRIDSRKWIAAKLKPRKYGERLNAELTGLDGGPIIIKAAPLDDVL